MLLQLLVMGPKRYWIAQRKSMCKDRRMQRRIWRLLLLYGQLLLPTRISQNLLCERIYCKSKRANSRCYCLGCTWTSKHYQPIRRAATFQQAAKSLIVIYSIFLNSKALIVYWFFNFFNILICTIFYQPHSTQGKNKRYKWKFPEIV